MQTFTNLPPAISDSISRILSRSDSRELSAGARRLHDQYMNRDKEKKTSYITGPSDVMAYLSLRSPATYAQIYSALLQIQQRIPDWQPKTILDLGCGPGTGIWAAKAIWSEITQATAIDQEQYFLSLGQEILQSSKLNIETTWTNTSITNWIETNVDKQYDLIIVANVLNELPDVVVERLLYQLTIRNSGVVLVLEPGTSVGYTIIQSTAEHISKKEKLIAPYIHNSFIHSDEYWIHFPQKFQRPEFQRRIRQSMRDSTLMASDWEETKFSYVAWGDPPIPTSFWAQLIGPAIKQKGFLIVPLLTEKGVVHTRVLKRHKQAYTFAKNLRWGEMIVHEQDILVPTKISE